MKKLFLTLGCVMCIGLLSEVKASNDVKAFKKQKLKKKMLMVTTSCGSSIYVWVPDNATFSQINEAIWQANADACGG